MVCFLFTVCFKQLVKVASYYGHLQGAIIIPVFIMNALFGLTGVIWSLLIAESLCALAAMLIVYLLRDRLTVDTSELIEG